MAPTPTSRFPRRVRQLHIAVSLCCVLVLAACGSDPAKAELVDQLSDPETTTSPTDLPFFDDHEQDWYGEEDYEEITEGDEAIPGVGSQPPQVERPIPIEVRQADPTGATPWAAGVVFASEFDGLNLLGEFPLQHWVVDEDNEPLYPMTSVDGDGAGGLVFVAGSTLWWEAANGVLTELFDVESDNGLRVADVDNSSLGPLALALWNDAGIQHLSGIALESPDEIAFDLIVSNDNWETHHAALTGDNTDRILLTGAANECLGLSAIDFDGASTPVHNVPLYSPAAVDPRVRPDVCSQASSIAASWEQGSLLVIAEAGSPAQITLYDTESGERVWLAPQGSGPYDPRVSIDIDTIDGSPVAVISGGSVSDPSYLVDVFSVFANDPQIWLANPVGTAGDPQSIRLAPGFGPNSVTHDPFLIGDAPDAIVEPAPVQGE